jgi:hydroxyacylglutathione hydrolase
MRAWQTKNGYKVIQVLKGRSNVFLVLAGGKSLLVDTSPKRKWNTLKRRLHELHIQHLDYLVLTHAHFDHAANAAAIRQMFTAQVIVHKEESGVLSQGKNIFPDGTNIFTHFIIRKLAPAFSSKFNYQPCKADIQVEKKYVFADFGINICLIHTPGHSPGSMSLIVDDEIAIVGDAMFGVFNGSVFPPFACDAKQLVDSWGNLLNTNCTLFLPSHGTSRKRKLLQKEYETSMFVN